MKQDKTTIKMIFVILPFIVVMACVYFQAVRIVKLEAVISDNEKIFQIVEAQNKMCISRLKI